MAFLFSHRQPDWQAPRDVGLPLAVTNRKANRQHISMHSAARGFAIHRHGVTIRVENGFRRS